MRLAPVESSAPHALRRLERALVENLRVDALGELPDRLERPSLGTDADDRVRSGLPDVLDRVQPEVDDALHDREVRLRRVHVGRQHLDSHVAAGVDVEGTRSFVFMTDEMSAHVLPRGGSAEPRRPVGDERVARRVRLLKE